MKRYLLNIVTVWFLMATIIPEWDKIGCHDLWARMPATSSRSLKVVNSPSMRARRFRHSAGLTAWSHRRGTEEINSSLMSFYPPHHLQANSLEHFRDLSKAEKAATRSGNKGQFEHLKGTKKVDPDTAPGTEQATESVLGKRSHMEIGESEKLYESKENKHDSCQVGKASKRQKKATLQAIKPKTKANKPAVRGVQAHQTQPVMSKNTYMPFAESTQGAPGMSILLSAYGGQTHSNHSTSESSVHGARATGTDCGMRNFYKSQFRPAHEGRTYQLSTGAHNSVSEAAGRLAGQRGHVLDINHALHPSMTAHHPALRVAVDFTKRCSPTYGIDDGLQHSTSPQYPLAPDHHPNTTEGNTNI